MKLIPKSDFRVEKAEIIEKVEESVSMDVEHTKVLIIGSGPAGYTAAIYAARANLEPVVLAGLTFGGQLMITTDVENFPGYPEVRLGPGHDGGAPEAGGALRREGPLRGRDQRVDFSKRPFEAETDGQKFTADAVIIATGASARWLGLDSEQRLLNRGVSACATCDGALFRDKDDGGRGRWGHGAGGGALSDALREQGHHRASA